MKQRANFFLTGVLTLLLGLQAIAQPQAEAELADKYFRGGEYESALDLYLKINRRPDDVAYVQRVVACYEMLTRFDEGIKYLERIEKRQTDIPLYPVLRAGLLEKTGQIKEADKLYADINTKLLRSQGDFVQVGSFLYQAQKLDAALATYRQARKTLRDPYLFSYEIASILQLQGQYETATDEYLNMYFRNPEEAGNAQLSIINMIEPASEAPIEKALLRILDKRPDDMMLRSLLFEYYVLAENFEEAFLQVKSIDRLFKLDGDQVLDFAMTMRNNKRYDLSNEALDYIIERKKAPPLYYQAHFEKAINGELQAFNQIPVDMAAVRQAVTDYGQLLEEFGRRPTYFDAIYRRAYLMIFYLDQLDAGLEELELLVRQRQMLNMDDWAKAKLLIGDVLLIKQDYNRAKLTYTEVSDSFKDRQLGALAKYKLGQLAYYRGEFSLAEALLSAIKDNTSNDISNDAIKLDLLILDNTGLDTTTTALSIFARAQLLSYQRKYRESLDLLDSLAYAYPVHSLTDEIIWEKVNIFLKQNDIQTALTFIDRILNEFPEDIYGDDALYTKARIYDYTLHNPEEAMKIYLDFLIRYPGSLFSVEVRKRIRELRQG
ncbi:MAG: hypothetical protein OHK0039_14810 [Bacteroidia bacterium]